MKRIFFLVTILLSLATVAIAQSDVQSVNNQEGTLESNVVKAPQKGFQFGAALRYGTGIWGSGEESFVLSAGYRFNRRNYLGLNIGVAHTEDGVNWDQGLQEADYIGSPISVEYIHYFPVGKAKSHSVYLGAEAGFIYSFGQSFLYDHGYNDAGEPKYEKVSLGAGIAVIKLGMEHPIYKRMHLNWGIRIGFSLGAGIGISF